MTFSLIVATVLYLSAGFSDGNFLGAKVYAEKADCEAFVISAREYYSEDKSITVTDCIPVAVPGVGA